VEKDNRLEKVDLDQLTLNKNSHVIFNVSCDFGISEKCRQKYTMEFRQYVKLTKTNNGKLPCLFCSRSLKFSNRNNPNTKYKSLDDNFFKKVDSREKAYLLGWIASDGHIGKRGFILRIHKKDKDVLLKLKSIICQEIPIRYKRTTTSDLCSFEINSKEISKDLCKLLNISPGKKSSVISFPTIDKKYLWDFVRGYFDGDGTINNIEKTCKNYLVVSIRSSSEKMLNGLKKNIDVKSYLNKNHSISWEKENAYTFCSFLYKDTDLYLNRKKERLKKWLQLKGRQVLIQPENNEQKLRF